MSNHSVRGKHFLISALAVVAGGCIYMLFRPVEPVFFKWFGSAGFENWLFRLRETSIAFGLALPPWLIYSLPNGLWAFAYTLLILGIWKGSHALIRYVWFLSIPLLVFGFELLQLTGDLPGTFCLYDMIWGAIGITLGYFTIYRIKHNQNLWI